MPVQITKGGQNYHLVPAPLVSYQKSFERADDGSFIGCSYLVTLNGDILPNKGNPIASGESGVWSQAAWTTSVSPNDDQLAYNYESDVLAATIAKQQKIRELFSSGTAIPVMIYGYGRNSGISFVGNVQEISFPEDGRWALPSKYSITLQTNKFDDDIPVLQTFVSDVQENWSIQESDQIKLNFNGYDLASTSKTYQVSHSVSAVGKPVYNTSGGYLNGISPWQQASGYVRGVVGIGPSGIPNAKLPSLFVAGSGFAVANRKITESVNKFAGTYEISEEYLVYKTGISPYAAIEQMSISTSMGEDGLNVIDVQGTVQGLDTNQNNIESTTTNAYSNASGYFSAIHSQAYNRALSFTGLDWIHPIFINSSVAREPNNGTIAYNYTYNDRPPNIISGSRVESISINDTHPGQLFASTPVIGRDQAVLTYLNSRSNYKRSLYIEVTMNRITSNWSGVTSNGYWLTAAPSAVRNWLSTQKPSLTQTAAFQTIFDAANPANDYGVIQSKVFYSEPQETWSPQTGRYSYQIDWTFEKE